MSHNIAGSVGFKARELDNTYVLHFIWKQSLYTLSREKKAAAQLHRNTRHLALHWAVPSVCSFVWVWDASSFQNRRRNGGGGWFRMITLCVFTIISKPWIYLEFGIYKSKYFSDCNFRKWGDSWNVGPYTDFWVCKFLFTILSAR